MYRLFSFIVDSWSISQAQSNNRRVGLQKCVAIADSTLQNICWHAINTEEQNTLATPQWRTPL